MKLGKRIICTLLAAVMVLGMAACAQEAPAPTEQLTAAPTKAPTEAPAEVPTETPTEPPVDPFTLEDDIVDSTNDTVIDFYEFLHEKEEEHKALLDEINSAYSDEFLIENTPDFYDTLDLVSAEEAELLLHTPMRMVNEVTTREAALKDVELLFRVFKCFYGAYFYYGGDEVFGAVRERIVKELEACPDTITMGKFAGIISHNLDFIRDRHMYIGETILCDYNNINLYDFCVKGLFFYQDDIGYYTRINDRKWYLQQVGEDTDILNYFQITVDEKGQLCYCILLCEPKNGEHLNIHEIILSRGDRTATMPIEWTMLGKRSFRTTGEAVTVKNNIPLLTVGFWENEDTDKNTAVHEVPGLDEQGERLHRMGPAFLKQDVFIFNTMSGTANDALTDSIPHAHAEVNMYRLSQLAYDLGFWNMPWKGQSVGPYYIALHTRVEKGQFARYRRPGLWGKNDTLIFTVQDKNNFSAMECHIEEIRAMENSLTIGGTAGGTSENGAGGNMVLYNTGLNVDIARGLYSGGTGSMAPLGVKPDIWCEPAEAVDAVYRLCEFYGIENKKDPSGLLKYNYGEVKDVVFGPPPQEEAQGSEEGYIGPQMATSDDRIRVAAFDHDLDGDGRKESYYLGVSVGVMADVLSVDTVHCIADGTNPVERTVHPCVWRLEGDGSYAAVEEFAELLTDVEVKVSRIEGIGKEPTSQSLKQIWPGTTRFTFLPMFGSLWQYEITAKIGDQTLSATGLTEFIAA